jgi:Cof subfamily protein (haloacid dehalogenase superfamily)
MKLETILNIQLVVSDIDGTFIDSEGTPSRGALDSIQKLRGQGIGFTLCSGRGDPGIRPFVELLKLYLPYIVSGGAAILDANDRSVIFQKLMSKNQVKSIIEIGLRSKCDMVLHTATQLFVLCSDDFWKTKCEERWFIKWGWKNVFRCRSMLELLDKPIIHIHLFNQDDRLPQLAEEVNDLHANVHVNIVVSKLEITDSQVNKGLALSYLADYLKVPLKNILAIGDDVNDISMLKTAGIGIAMKNSPPDVISQVDYLAPGNDEGGVASMINHLLSDTLDCLRTNRN